jgi:hypothetical protein
LLTGESLIIINYQFTVFNELSIVNFQTDPFVFVCSIDTLIHLLKIGNWKLKII